jgi:ribosome-associated translation inhibitor RaiA
MTQRPLRISSRDLDLSSSTRALISERVQGLEHFYPQLVGCTVLVQGPGRHHRRGGPYSVRLDLRVPDAEPIIVARQRAEDLQVAIRESFDAAQRRLEDLARVQRRKVKRHRGQPTGDVVRVVPSGSYGFIETDDLPTRQTRWD